MKRIFKKTTAFLLVVMMVLPLVAAITPFISFAADRNVAIGKPTTTAAGDGSAAVDGDTGSFWDGAECPTSLTIDLEKAYNVSKIKVIPYYADGRSYTFKIEYSLDGVSFSEYASKSDDTATTAAGFTYEKDVEAQYVKVTMLSNSANPAGHINELMVYGSVEGGDEDLVDPNDPDNIAYGKPTRSNSTESFHENAVDGNLNTSWIGADYPKYVDIDLMANYDLSKIHVYMPSGTWAYKVYGSLDGVSFDEIASFEKAKVSGDGEVFELKDKTYRIIRVNVLYSTTSSWGSSSIREVKVYGAKSDTAVIPTRETLEFTSYEEWMKSKYNVELKDGYTVEDTYKESDTIEAVQGIVTRILGDKYNDWFVFDVVESSNDNDYYEISMDGEKVKIIGNEGVSIATGLNYYLKYYCNVHVSQQTEQVKMPEKVVKVEKTIRTESPYEVRYAYNYCTLSYTMPFYGYEEWQRELDYLALSGVNVILDTTATEAMWVMYLQQFGYTADEAKNFVCGYAYKAWWLMGNLENYGGTVSDSWIIDTLELARTNQRFMTVLGIQPCLQGFMGTLPTTFEDIADKTLKDKGYSDITPYMVAQGTWSGFTRPPLLKTTYDGYKELADTFYDVQKYIYGDITDYYAGDLAHEGGVIPSDLSRSGMTAEILNYMMDNDEDAVWIIQCWWGNPEKAVLEGFGENREDHVLVLDLNATIDLNYKNTTSWGGKEWNNTSWVFCMLDNYGGRPGMHGELVSMMEEIVKAKNTASHMKGIGLVAEGTQMNPIVQELLWEMAWRDETFDMDEWVKQYCRRRYGIESESIEKAWDILLDTAYGYEGSHDFNINSLVNMRPSFTPSAISGSYTLDYEPELLEEALGYFMEDFQELSKTETYIYDLVDLMKQVVSNSMVAYFKTLVEAYNTEDMASFTKMKDKFLSAIILLDEICQYEVDSTIGEWVGRVDDWCKSSKTSDYDDYSIEMMKINAKAIITTWSSKPLLNYAYRQYSGLLLDYHYKTWEAWLTALENGTTQPSDKQIFDMAWDFVISDGEYSRKVLDPVGGSINRGLQTIYNDIMKNYLTANAVVLRSYKYNVALRGEAYAKTAKTENPVANINDGDTGNLWIATNGNPPSYAGITLDKEYYVDEITIVAEPRSIATDRFTYKVEVKENGDFVTVYEGTNYDSKKKAYTITIKFEEPKLISDVKVNITEKNGQMWPALAEIKVMSYNEIAFDATKLAGATFDASQKTLKGVASGTTVEALLAAVSGRQGTLTVVDTNGKTLSGSDVVTNGSVIKLTYGETVDDEITVTVGGSVIPDTTPTPDQTPDNTPDETTAPGTDDDTTVPPTTGGEEPDTNNNTVVYVIIAVVAVIIVGAVVLVVIKKKKA